MKTEILAIDPSGSWKEGKGQSGWVKLIDGKLESFGIIKAADYNSRTEYWDAHADLIKNNLNPNLHIVIENYRLYSTHATSHINSELETARLLGFLEHYIIEYLGHLELHFQMAHQVKKRFNDKILIRKELMTRDSNGRYFLNGINVAGHVVDALRHACYFDLTKG